MFSLFAMPLFGLGSWPYWTWEINRQIRTAPFEGFAPDPGQFGGFGVIAGVLMTTFLGSLVGLVMVWLARRRNERGKALRTLAWILNGLGALCAVYLLGSHMLRHFA
jgi:hypothetical protein